MGNDLHIGNLPITVTDSDLLELFGKIGPVDTASIMMNADTGLSPGVGLVRMINVADAVTTINRLNFTRYKGQIMSVSKGRRIGEN